MSFLPLRIDGDLSVSAEGLTVVGWSGPRLLPFGGRQTVFGMVVEGSEILCGEDRLSLRATCYFVSSAPVRVLSGRGLAVIAPSYRGLPQFGGPLEGSGRLRYIDGCTDTLLVCPPRLGEPCLNHLHLPASTDQSDHTHPSVRIGVIARGSGVCRSEGERYRLSEGLGWIIETGTRHSFQTGPSETLDVMAWHPDSDFGPTDGDHPMINRTFV